MIEGGLTMEETKPYRVLLYYKYVTINDPEVFTKEHLQFCKELGLKGRILIASEGINGTVSGTVEQTDKYMETLKNDPRFEDIVFKIDEAEKHAFKKMHVRFREEIVSLKLEEDIQPTEITGNYLSPKDFYENLQREDVIVIDARNDYEHQIGHFRNAILPDVEAFRDLPKWIRDNLAEHKDKKVLTYCTGGIRCEKFTGFLLQEGFQDVNQLHGGIVEYGKDPEVQGKMYDGKCYVFDERIAVPINRTDEDVIVSECYYCGKKEDRLVNCANPECNRQHVSCEACEEEHHRSCSQECREHPRNRYDLEKQQSLQNQ
jgi:UPF0176 protein